MSKEDIFSKYHFSGDPNNKNDVYEFLLTETSNGMLKKEKVFQLCFPSLYKDIKSIHWNSNWSFSQIMSHYFNPDIQCTCLNCGAPTKYKCFKQGYSQYCSSKCSNSDSIKKEKTTKIIQEKYGVDCVFQSKEIKDKTKQTCLKKYGVEYAQSSKDVKDKCVSTCLKKYGVKTPFEMSDFWQKAKDTNRKKYGVDYPAQSKGLRDIIAQSYRNKTGYDNPSYNPEVIEKRRKTNFEHYDGLWVTQTPEFIERSHKDFLSRHPDIIGETDDDYIVKCDDNQCKLCSKKEFSIEKRLYCQRASQKSIICPIKLPCIGSASIEELGLLTFLQNEYPGEIVTNDRSIIAPYELDIYIPDKRIAIEFNGIFWHSDYNPRIDKFYHQKKSMLCRSKGIQLLHIWEDDWKYKQDIIKDFIRAKLGLITDKIYARKCVAKEITSQEARGFVNDNHIQGYVNSTYKIGLFYQNELVSVMLVGNLRNTMGSKPTSGHYEIYRMVSKMGLSVVGGFSKLLSYFEKTYNPEEIITYGDLCYTEGNVYKQTGFEEVSLSQPCYSWVIKDRRYHRSNFMKHKLIECKFDPTLTEDEVMRQRHAYKVWDAGKIKFTKRYN